MNRNKILFFMALSSIGTIGLSLANETETHASSYKASFLNAKEVREGSGKGKLLFDFGENGSEVVKILDPQRTHEDILTYYNGAKDKNGKRPRETYFIRQRYGNFYWYSPVIYDKNGVYKNVNKHVSSPGYMYENLYVNGKSVPIERNRKTQGVKVNTGCSAKNHPNHVASHIIAPKYKHDNGKSYEYRYMGFNDKGEVIANPYFPSDESSGKSLTDYPWAKYPWAKSGQVNGVPTPIISGGKTIYDDMDFPSSKRSKTMALDRLLKQEPAMRNVENILSKCQKCGASMTKGSTTLTCSKKCGYSLPRYRKTASDWLYYFSLRTNPTLTTPAFTGGYIQSAPGNPTFHNRTWYRTADVEISNVGDEEIEKNLQIKKIEVLDAKGKVVGSYTRKSDTDTNMKGIANSPLFRGMEYTVRVTIRNSKTTNIDRVGYVDNYVVNGANANSADPSKKEDAFISNTKKTSSKMSSKAERTVEYKFKVPTNTGDLMKIQARVGEEHMKYAENSIYSDDIGYIPFNVKSGDLVAKKVILYNETLKREEPYVDKKNVIPGHKYKVGFEGVYDGETLYDSKGAVLTKKVPIKTYIKRYSPSGTSELKEKVVYANVKFQKGASFTVYTDTYLFEVPRIETSALIDPSTHEEGYNNNLNNDGWKQEYKSPYNIKISNAKLLPKVERVLGKEKIKVAVKYDVELDVPLAETDYQIDTNTAIKVGNSSKNVTDHLKKGLNKDIVHEIEVDVSPNTTVPGSVFVNFDKADWEDDRNTQADNKANTSSNINGSVSDMILDIKSYPNPYNGACPLSGVKTNRTWVQSYSEMDWSAVKTNYNVGNKTFTFYKFTSANKKTTQKNQNESYTIDNVLFKSKMTTDLKMGDKQDGWVDLLKEKGKIKAGYGYELKVNVSYKTNAFSTQPKDYINTSTGSGHWVRPKHVAPNLPSDLYIKTLDGKLLSASGINGSIKGLNVKTTGKVEDGKKTWTYTIKPKNTLGFKEAGKIYISENTPDGDYNLEVFTPNVNGIATKPGYGTDLLCDKRNMTIEVDGSMLDDLNDHITQ